MGFVKIQHVSGSGPCSSISVAYDRFLFSLRASEILCIVDRVNLKYYLKSKINQFVGRTFLVPCVWVLLKLRSIFWTNSQQFSVSLCGPAYMPYHLLTNQRVPCVWRLFSQHGKDKLDSRRRLSRVRRQLVCCFMLEEKSNIFPRNASVIFSLNGTILYRCSIKASQVPPKGRSIYSQAQNSSQVNWTRSSLVGCQLSWIQVAFIVFKVRMIVTLATKCIHMFIHIIELDSHTIMRCSTH